MDFNAFLHINGAWIFFSHLQNCKKNLKGAIKMVIKCDQLNHLVYISLKY